MVDRSPSFGPPRQKWRKAKGLHFAKLAGDLNNDDPTVLTMLSSAHFEVTDLEVVSALIDKALALDSNSAIAWNRSG
jgi:adenylate cyclase